MDVRLDGRIGFGLIPGPHLTLGGGRILGARGEAVASARTARLYFRTLPLIRGALQLNRVELTQPKLSIERDTTGSLNVGRLKRAIAMLGGMQGGGVKVTDGSLRFADLGSGRTIEATGIRLDLGRIRLAGERNPLDPRGLSFRAKLACAEIRTESRTESALEAFVEGKNGVVVADPITTSLFGGQGKGSVRVEFTDGVPRYRVRGTLTNFRIEESLKILSPIKAAEGEMSFSMDLSMEGDRWHRLVESATGEVSLRGRDLTLLSHDLDGAISRFEASQNFNFVDVGAVFLTGPLGLAVTKGYSFASLFAGTGGTTKLGTVVSDWTVERGVARARDVALTTAENRLAVQGGLDFVGRRFDDMTLAVVDEEGCSKLRQTIRGSFENPDVDKPHVLTSLAGPLVSALKKAKDLLPTGPCEVFYSGSVKHPSQEPETD
jgi:AsmA protein